MPVPLLCVSLRGSCRLLDGAVAAAVLRQIKSVGQRLENVLPDGILQGFVYLDVRDDIHAP
ncbi:hypothetical protein NL451_28635, partial [Klebsiella pneumoniae]|nr:hypothetical protein [Klebsiella pneumoniae]